MSDRTAEQEQAFYAGYTPAEFAVEIRRSVATVRRLIRDRQVECMDVSAGSIPRYIIPRHEAERFKRERTRHRGDTKAA